MNSRQFAARVDQVAKAFATAESTSHAPVLLSLAGFLRTASLFRILANNPPYPGNV